MSKHALFKAFAGQSQLLPHPLLPSSLRPPIILKERIQLIGFCRFHATDNGCEQIHLLAMSFPQVTEPRYASTEPSTIELIGGCFPESPPPPHPNHHIPTTQSTTDLRHSTNAPRHAKAQIGGVYYPFIPSTNEGFSCTSNSVCRRTYHIHCQAMMWRITINRLRTLTFHSPTSTPTRWYRCTFILWC